MKDKVVIGNAGAEFGVRGYVSAYDADTGELAWRFYVVPGDPAAGPDGAASDEALAELAATDLVRPTGTTMRRRRHAVGRDRLRRGARPALRRHGQRLARGTASIRSDGKGDNLFLSTVLALDPDTGEYLWHYQESPGESWDYTSAQPMMLADLTIAGEPRKVAHARAEERLLLRARPPHGQGALGEQLRAEYWATHVDLATGRPAIAANAYYDDGPFVGSPTGLRRAQLVADVVQPAHRPRLLPRVARLDDLSQRSGVRVPRGLNNTGIYRGPPTDEDRALNAANPPLTGSSLIAWDPVAGGPRFEIDGFGGGVLTTAANSAVPRPRHDHGRAHRVRRRDRRAALVARDAERDGAGPDQLCRRRRAVHRRHGGPRLLRRQRRRRARAQPRAHLRVQARRHGHAAAGPRPRAARESARGDLLAGGRGARAPSRIACIARAATAARRIR